MVSCSTIQTVFQGLIQRNFSSDFVTLSYSINEESSNRLNKVLRERIHGLVKLDNSFNISDTELSIVPNKTSFPHPSKPTHFPSKPTHFPSNPPVFRSNSHHVPFNSHHVPSNPLISILTPIMSHLTPSFPF